MKITPLATCRAPRYPTRDVVDADPEALARLPRRWQRQGVLAAAAAIAGTMAAGLAGPAQAADAQVERVAPIFKRGEGMNRGIMGTTFSISPVLLTEAEARDIIKEETRAAGLAFTNDCPPVVDVAVPGEDAGKARTEQKTLTVVLDGADEKHKVAFEYVSQEDAAAWKIGAGPRVGRDTLPAAQAVRDGLAAVQPAVTMGVFYDPMVHATYEMFPDTNKTIDQAKTEARDLLRQQVKDFIVWLKAQGVI